MAKERLQTLRIFKYSIFKYISLVPVSRDCFQDVVPLRGMSNGQIARYEA